LKGKKEPEVVLTYAKCTAVG